MYPLHCIATLKYIGDFIIILYLYNARRSKFPMIKVSKTVCVPSHIIGISMMTAVFLDLTEHTSLERYSPSACAAHKKCNTYFLMNIRIV